MINLISNTDSIMDFILKGKGLGSWKDFVTNSLQKGFVFFQVGVLHSVSFCCFVQRKNQSLNWIGSFVVVVPPMFKTQFVSKADTFTPHAIFFLPKPYLHTFTGFIYFLHDFFFWILLMCNRNIKLAFKAFYGECAMISQGAHWWRWLWRKIVSRYRADVEILEPTSAVCKELIQMSM